MLEWCCRDRRKFSLELLCSESIQATMQFSSTIEIIFVLFHVHSCAPFWSTNSKVGVSNTTWLDGGFVPLVDKGMRDSPRYALYERGPYVTGRSPCVIP